MGRVIRETQSAGSQIRDVKVTLRNAQGRGEPYHTDAENYLRAFVDRAAGLTESMNKVQEEADQVRSEQAMQNVAINEALAALRDHLFNLCGRHVADPKFRHLFPKGLIGYTDAPLVGKAAALRRLARLLETIDHPKIPQDVADQNAALLRSSADALEAIQARLRPLLHELRDLGLEYTSNARLANLQLRRLKKHWSGDGLTEQEIHIVIPHRPAAAAATAPAERVAVESENRSAEEDEVAEPPDVATEA